jgi:4-hydroxy-tetrahydrodipicolinate reductase
MSIEVLLSGATGTLGRTVAECIDRDEGFRLSGTASSERFFEPDVEADVIVDFSHPALLRQVLAFAHRRRLPLVIGTTGLADELSVEIDEAARDIAICQAANFSLGVNLMLRLVAEAAGVLGKDFDVEICEMHHRRKLDAPSGTALALGESLARARHFEGADPAVFDRSRHRIPRAVEEIGYQSIRGGDVAGEHTVYFLGQGERLEITHRANDRAIFARGALLAAQRLIDHPPGRVEFIDLVLAASP